MVATFLTFLPFLAILVACFEFRPIRPQSAGKGKITDSCLRGFHKTTSSLFPGKPSGKSGLIIPPDPHPVPNNQEEEHWAHAIPHKTGNVKFGANSGTSSAKTPGLKRRKKFKRRNEMSQSWYYFISQTSSFIFYFYQKDTNVDKS